MATAISLEPNTIDAIDALVARGRFASRDAAIRVALDSLQKAYADPVLGTQDEVAGVERGLADVAAGRVFSAEHVRAELERRHAARL